MEDHNSHKKTQHKHQEISSDSPNKNEHKKHEKNNKGKNHETHDNHGDDHGDDHENHHEKMVNEFRTRFYISMLLTVPILILSPLIQDFLGYEIEFQGLEYVLLGLSTIIYIYGGKPFFKGLIEEFKETKPGMMTLVTLAISVSYLYSGAVVLVIDEGKFFFWELATLIDIMLVGHWIEMRSVMGASQALKELAKLIPSEAHLIIDNDTTKEVRTDSLEPGDEILVKPGEKIPTDGRIIKGSSSLNEAAITGESKPVPKSENDEVIGGSINGEGSIRVKVEKTGKDTYLSQVMDLVDEAQKNRSKAQDLANRAAFYLTIIAIVAGFSTFVIWISLGQDYLFALERMVTVMVITCPHALGLAVPLVVSTSTSISAKNGVLVRDRQSFERSRNVDKIIFDKTGTLTKGEFGVDDILSFTDTENEEIISLTASLEAESEHSIARAIVKHAEQNEISVREIDEFSAIPGKGIQGKIDGEQYYVVSPGYLKEKNIEYPQESIDQLHKEGKTVVFLLKNDEAIGALALADIVREDSKEAIKQLQDLGIETIMLTGDNEKVAAYVAKQLGIEKYYAEVLPDEKADTVNQIKSDGSIVAMVGDGINDAPALVTADIGYAIGAGTDVAIESADIILVKDNPADILSALKLSRKTYGKMQQNLAWATGYNLIALPLAAGVFYNIGVVLSPAVGAALMSLSTVIVAINARLLKID